MRLSSSVVSSSILLAASSSFQLALGREEDRFNYRSTDGNDYGPADWSKVTCDQPGECPGWPDGWELGIGWELNTNKCEWCPENGQHSCGLHRQSPIDLYRADSTTGHDTECYDYHWMAYEDQSCRWSDIIDNPNTPERNNFQIRSHSLQILTPVNENGELQCLRQDGRNAFPRLDYSKGFPNWWHLSHTEVTVRSEHFQEGKQYDAEVHLAHFYEIEHVRQMGKVAIFLQADANRSRWPFLDKLICQWREVEDKTREECGLASVSATYPGCRNPNRGGGNPTSPPPSPVASPTSTPVANPTPESSPTTSPVTAPTGGGNGVVCADYIGHPTINLDRICKDGGCCENPRDASNHCHSVYKFFGDDMDDVCSDCCNPSKEVGPAPPTHPTYPPIDCTTVNNPFRMCKPNSCCDQFPSSGSSYCNELYSTHGNGMASICWYCCSEPNDVGLTESVVVAGPTSVPVSSPTSPPVTGPTPVPVSSPTTPPVTAPTPPPYTVQNPTVSPVAKNSGGVVCSDPTINMDRICKDGSCCDSTRSATDFCQRTYEFFGDDMASVCSDCCSPSKQLAPAPAPHPTYPPIQCSSVNNAYRICKPNSCCEPVASLSSHCQGVYDTYGDSMGSVCWYCCSEPKEVDPTVLSNARYLGQVTELPGTSASTNNEKPEAKGTMEEKVRRDVLLPQGFYASELKMDPSNFEVNENLEEEYLAGIEEYRDLREQEEAAVVEDGHRRLNGDNYADVRYSPYQWMREVKTEYYFRYEGGQMVPPCFETVHYRVMKDPIRIHTDQLAELERLLAQRISPRGSGYKECENETVGRPREGSNGNAVDLNRPLQSYSNIHRKVFCECDDWKSKFQEDVDWCKMNENQRWYDEPYNFDSGGNF